MAFSALATCEWQSWPQTMTCSLCAYSASARAIAPSQRSRDSASPPGRARTMNRAGAPKSMFRGCVGVTAQPCQSWR